MLIVGGLIAQTAIEGTSITQTQSYKDGYAYGNTHEAWSFAASIFGLNASSQANVKSAAESACSGAWIVEHEWWRQGNGAKPSFGWVPENGSPFCQHDLRHLRYPPIPQGRDWTR